MRKLLTLVLLLAAGGRLAAQDSLNIRSLSHRTFAGDGCGVLVMDTLVYLAADTMGVRIFNCANPLSPVQLPGLNTPGRANDIRAANGKFYVADGPAGLRILDSNIPPNELGFYDTPGNANAVVVRGNYAYVADMGGGLRIIDVSNPANPTEVGNYAMANTYSVTLDGDLAYCANGGSGWDNLTILNVSNPANITLVSQTQMPDYTFKVALNNQRAFIACNYAGLRAYDVTDPQNPLLLGTHVTQGFVDWVVVQGNYAFIAEGGNGIKILNVSDPANMTEVGRYKPLSGTAYMVDIDAHYIYLAHGADGFYILKHYIPPHLLQPDFNAQINTNPSFQWTEVPQSFGYHLQIGQGDFGHIVVDTITPGPQCVLAGQLGDGSYVWRVRSSDGLGGWTPWSSVWAFIVDTTSPSISVIHRKLTMDADYEFFAEIDQGGMGNIARVVLYWDKAGGSMSAKQFDLIRQGSTDTFRVTVPGSDIPRQGVRFRLEAADSAGNIGWWPNMSGDYFIRSVHFSSPLQINVDHDTWQMISIPTDARGRNIFNMLTDEFGAYDKTKWRLFLWHQGGYQEIDSPTFNLAQINRLGTAYWLRKREGPNVIVFEGPDSSYGNFVPSAAEAIVLQPGWNDIGSPFLFPIEWSNVTPMQSNVFGPYFYSPSQQRWLYPPEVTAPSSNLPLLPYNGYAYRNDNAVPVNLIITPLAQPKGQAVSQDKGGDVWQAKLILSNGRGTDHNYFGFASDALAGRDAHDYPEPPSELTGASGYFLVDGQPCCSDLRPFAGQAQTWDFVVRCQEAQNSLILELPASTGLGLRCYLLDQRRDLAFDLSSDPEYQFTAEPGEEVRSFKVVLCRQGDEGWLSEKLRLPAVNLIKRIAPNPFRDRVEIEYQISRQAPVALGIYNINGQRVRTLLFREQLPGHYRAVWEGRDDSGRPLGNGVYILRMAVGNEVIAKSLTLVK